MLTVARIIMVVLGVALSAIGFAVLALKKYHFVRWPNRTSTHRREARFHGAVLLLIGPTLAGGSFMGPPVVVVMAAFAMLVAMACLALMWRTDIKYGDPEQGSDQDPPEES